MAATSRNVSLVRQARASAAVTVKLELPRSLQTKQSKLQWCQYTAQHYTMNTQNIFSSTCFTHIYIEYYAISLFIRSVARALLIAPILMTELSGGQLCASQQDGRMMPLLEAKRAGQCTLYADGDISHVRGGHVVPSGGGGSEQEYVRIMHDAHLCCCRINTQVMQCSLAARRVWGTGDAYVHQSSTSLSRAGGMHNCSNAAWACRGISNFSCHNRSLQPHCQFCRLRVQKPLCLAIRPFLQEFLTDSVFTRPSALSDPNKPSLPGAHLHSWRTRCSRVGASLARVSMS